MSDPIPVALGVYHHRRRGHGRVVPGPSIATERPDPTGDPPNERRYPLDS
ncbi:MAG: hypothetical protein ABEI98_09680 [Halorhabdus sp.]